MGINQKVEGKERERERETEERGGGGGGGGLVVHNAQFQRTKSKSRQIGAANWPWGGMLLVSALTRNLILSK